MRRAPACPRTGTTVPRRLAARAVGGRVPRLVAAAGALALLLVLPAVPAPAPAPASVAVVVSAREGAAAAAAAAVRAAGGRVTAVHAPLDTLAADLPPGAAPALRADPAVAAVTADLTLRLAGSPTRTGSPGVGSGLHVARATGATAYWSAGLTGSGVDVALLDSGVSPVHGLHEPARLVHGPDLTAESQDPGLAHLDTYGHGTHLAGLLAGRDTATTGPGYARGEGGFTGLAPDARLVSVKVADSGGGTDVSQVLAGVAWVVQNRRVDDLDIRVLALAFGTDTRLAAAADPLVRAVEVAWAHGITVVVAGGNDGFATGPGAPGLRHPAASPVVLAVGATDTRATDTVTDDDVAAYSSSGPGGRRGRNPDLVAPGTGLESLRVPGSRIDEQVPGDGGRLLRGSGTSQATAVVAGAAALLLQQRPGLTPDQVKRLLTTTARALPGAPREHQGAGALDLGGALSTATPTVTAAGVRATGDGSLDDARGTVRVVRDGVALRGERDLLGAGWSPGGVAAATAPGAWVDGWWNGSRWSGSGFGAATLSSRSWSAALWATPGWSGGTWGSLSSRSWSSSGWSSGSWGPATTEAGGLGAAAWSTVTWSRP